MSLSNIAPIKIRIKEIKDSDFYHTESTPIKIKICDRNKNMEQSYENKQAKVREKNGKIVIKNKKDILDTDQILEYLSNDYIKPIRIKISTLNLVYDWLYDLWLKFNFSALIQAKYILVVSYGKFVATLFNKAVIFQTFSTFWGRPKFTLKLKHTIELALDIFKVEGLKIAIRFKQRVSGLQVYYETFRDKLLVKHKIGMAITSYAENIIPLILKFKQEINRPIMQYYGVIRDIDCTRIKDITDKTIGEIAEETLSFLMRDKPIRFYFSAIANITLSVLQSFESKFISKITSSSNISYYAKPFGEISQYAQVDAVVHTYTIVDEIANDTIGNISDKTIEEITVKYS